MPLPAVKGTMNETDTLQWKNTDEARRRKNSLTWKEINAESPKKARSDSSSYSENSDSESSTSTSLCDDEKNPSLDSTPKKKRRHKDMRRIAKDESSAKNTQALSPLVTVESEVLCHVTEEKAETPPTISIIESIVDNLGLSEGISSISQLSPMPDISSYFSTAISPIKSPSNYYDFPDFSAFSIGSSLSATATIVEVAAESFDIGEQGVTNEFFERVTSSSAFNKLPTTHDFVKLKHIHQKSLSMEEDSRMEEDLGRINRSFSDGTIISNETGDIFQKIIAENSKILTRFSNESLTSSSTRTPIVEEPILEELLKSPEENSSECEEIAAIDIEECTSGDGIQDIADIIELKSQNSISPTYNVVDLTKPSATLSLLACNATSQNEEEEDDDVTVQNEKSMNGKNSEENEAATTTTMATLQTTCNALTLHNNESFAQKSLPLKDAPCEVETVISPKFNEISDLVDKLKKVMESDLQKAEESDKKVEKIEEIKLKNDECGEVKVMEKIEVKDTTTNNGNNNHVDKDAVSVTITINTCVEEKKVENDLEKSCSHEEEKKIDDSSLSKLNTQLEKCQSNEQIKSTTKEEVKAAKDSAKILENLNFQLQRYEDVEKSPVAAPRRSPSTERATDYKKELENLMKEREHEKRAKSPTYRYEDSSPQPTIPSVNSSFAPYDHEPRNEFRRRDIASLESTQQMRRPFKSSPSSSLSSSPSSNIHSTLSSIQNTIKTLDSACQRSEIYNYKKLDKAMDCIEKMCESDREWHFYKRTRNYESPPSFKIDDILASPSSTSRRTFIDDRDLSPKPSNFLRYENESVRKPPKTPELDPNYIARLRCLSTEDYIAGRLSPSGVSPSREFNTSFDRCSRIDRSPTSPSLSTRFLKSPTGDRTSKSAENSPSRCGGDSNSATRYSRYSPTNSRKDFDLKAESMSNLSYKSSSAFTDNNKKYYDTEWEKSAASRRKFDI